MIDENSKTSDIVIDEIRAAILDGQIRETEHWKQIWPPILS
jgi:hypothetical protein